MTTTFKAAASTAALLLGSLTLSTATQAQGRPDIWNGFYVGAQVGGGWSRLTGPGIDVTVDPSGAIFGGYAGYNIQTQGIVFGLEGSLNGATLKWSHADSGTTATNSYIGSLRGRVGVASGAALFYGTGGAAFTSFKVSDGIDSITKSSTGWVVGLGLEYQIAPNWVGRIEGLHHQFKYSFDDASATQRVNTLAVGVAYKF